MNTTRNTFGPFLVLSLLAITTMIGCNSEQAKQDANSAETSISKATASTRVALDNDATSAKVKEALMSATDMQTKDLKVNSEGKKVTLIGAVPTADQKKRAVSITKSLLGTGYSVDDELKVVH
jgi:osmotically-inducible protein OsmY